MLVYLLTSLVKNFGFFYNSTRPQNSLCPQSTRYFCKTRRKKFIFGNRTFERKKFERSDLLKSHILFIASLRKTNTVFCLFSSFIFEDCSLFITEDVEELCFCASLSLYFNHKTDSNEEWSKMNWCSFDNQKQKII